jgi:hypothetical protein
MVRKLGQFAYRYAISTPGVYFLRDRLEGDHFLYSYFVLSGCLFAALRSDCSSQEAVGSQQESQTCVVRIACFRPTSVALPVKSKNPDIIASWVILVSRQVRNTGCESIMVGNAAPQTQSRDESNRRGVEAMPIQRRVLRSCVRFRSRERTPTRRFNDRLKSFVVLRLDARQYRRSAPRAAGEGHHKRDD